MYGGGDWGHGGPDLKSGGQGGEILYNEQQDIMGNSHMGTLPVYRQIDRYTWLKTLPSSNSVGRR